jgi:uroporphyrinogen decarboxylase
MMTGYERFMTALLRRGEPDRVPVWELIVNEPTLSAFGAGSLEGFADVTDMDGITIFEDMRLTSLDTDEQRELIWRGRTIASGTRRVVRDEWGIVWGVTEFGIPYPLDGPINTVADLHTYTPPDPEAPHRLASLREAVKRFKGRKAIVFLTHDGFEFPHYLRGGMEHLLVDYLDGPRLNYK